MNINPSLIDVEWTEHDGYPPEKEGEDTRDQMMAAVQEAGATATDMPDYLRLDPKYWPEKSKENDETFFWPINFIDRFTNQNPTHECTCHSLTRGAEAAWNRQRRISVGPPIPGERLPISAQSASVWFSCISIYAEANPRQWGGASCRQVLSIAMKRGFLPDKIQPREYEFKHTLHGTCGKGNKTQSSGPWTPVSRFPEGWQETSKHFRPVEVIFPDSWEDMVCLVLAGYVVNVGRNGHAIPYVKWLPEEKLMAYTDSYDVIRYDSINTMRKAVGGASAIATMTQPDDYLRPAA